MAGIFDKLFGHKKETAVEDYVEIEGQFEGMAEESGASMLIKIAELGSLHDLPDLKKEVYNGNVVIIDYSLIRHDDLNRDRALRDLKQVASDVHGDIAGLEETKVIVAPTGVRIDRTKISPRGKK